MNKNRNRQKNASKPKSNNPGGGFKIVSFTIPFLTIAQQSSITLHHALNTTPVHVDFFDSSGIRQYTGPFWTVYDANTIQLDVRHVTDDLTVRIIA